VRAEFISNKRNAYIKSKIVLASPDHKPCRTTNAMHMFVNRATGFFSRPVHMIHAHTTVPGTHCHRLAASREIVAGECLLATCGSRCAQRCSVAGARGAAGIRARVVGALGGAFKVGETIEFAARLGVPAQSVPGKVSI